MKCCVLKVLKIRGGYLCVYSEILNIILFQIVANQLLIEALASFYGFVCCSASWAYKIDIKYVCEHDRSSRSRKGSKCVFSIPLAASNRCLKGVVLQRKMHLKIYRDPFMRLDIYCVTCNIYYLSADSDSPSHT